MKLSWTLRTQHLCTWFIHIICAQSNSALWNSKAADGNHELSTIRIDYLFVIFEKWVPCVKAVITWKFVTCWFIVFVSNAARMGLITNAERRIWNDYIIQYYVLYISLISVIDIVVRYHLLTVLDWFFFYLRQGWWGFNRNDTYKFFHAQKFHGIINEYSNFLLDIDQVRCLMVDPIYQWY